MVPDLPLRVRDVSAGFFRGKVVVDSTMDHFLRNDGNPDDLLVDNSDFLKSSESTCSALVQIPAASTAGDLEPLFVKEFLFKGIVHSLKPRFRPHRAQVMWRVSWHLLNHSIPVAEPEGYLIKQAKDIARSLRIDREKIPPKMDFYRVPGLTREAREKLDLYRPQTIGEAKQIPSLTPAAITNLHITLKLQQRKRQQKNPKKESRPKKQHKTPS